jgi:NDP-sugar pyrophosphorylase family protein
MILAAGFGNRLRPLTDHLPKPLLPVGEIPLIHYNLFLLKKYNITDIVINVHYHAEKIMAALGDGSRFGVQITYSEESTILGTGGGIKNLQSFFGNDPFLVINADILVDIDLSQLIAFHQEKRSSATLVLRKDPDMAQYGIIEMDDENRIRNILSKIPLGEAALKKRMFTGIHVITSKVLDYIPPGTVCSIIDSYIEMIRKEERLYGYSMDGYWNDIGVLKRYRDADQQVKEGKVVLHYMRQ